MLSAPDSMILPLGSCGGIVSGYTMYISVHRAGMIVRDGVSQYVCLSPWVDYDYSNHREDIVN